MFIGWGGVLMAISFTKNSNKHIDHTLRDKILSVAQAYSEDGLLHIGYVLHHLSDVRESQYIPADSSLPTLVICSVYKDVTAVRSIYGTEHDAVTSLRTTLGLKE